jgi:hypothetical protein
MNVKRTATIVLGGGALAAWWAGAATSNRELPDPVIVRSAPIDARGAELASEIARLHERLRPTATPRQASRNLFAFHTAAHARLAPAAPPPAAVEAPVQKPVLALPVFKLAGIAEDPGADGVVRTAIISGEGQVYLVKEGDELTKRYRVAKISAEVVELADQIDGTTRRLALK